MISRIFIAAAIVGSAAHAGTQVSGELVNIDARYVFAPLGFDDNDETTIVVDGYLPNGCYKLTRPEMVVDNQTRTITIKPMARYFDVPCVEALIPYHFEVKPGVLSEGTWDIKLNDDNVENLEVAEATSAGPDEELYAPIDAVSVTTNDGRLQAVLQGRFTNSCMAWQELRTEDNGKSINILPIMEVRGEDCTAGEYPFTKVVDLPDSINAGRHLLHVRSLNGNAINYLFFKSPY